jgi:hypothetical protein
MRPGAGALEFGDLEHVTAGRPEEGHLSLRSRPQLEEGARSRPGPVRAPAVGLPHAAGGRSPASSSRSTKWVQFLTHRAHAFSAGPAAPMADARNATVHPSRQFSSRPGGQYHRPAAYRVAQLPVSAGQVA